MSRPKMLRKLESILESFLDRAADLKSKEATVPGGIDRLDDIACSFLEGDDRLDDLGNWFAEHAEWTQPETISAKDRGVITEILGEIRRELRVNEESSPAVAKIAGEIDRWNKATRSGGHKVVLKRGPEIAPPPGSVTLPANNMKPPQGAMEPPILDSEAELSDTIVPPFEDSIALFRKQIDRLTGRFADSAENRMHLLSVLDDTLKSAELQKSKDALILSALIIYYLKQSGYLVLPYVERLREAEKLQKGSAVR